MNKGKAHAIEYRKEHWSTKILPRMVKTFSVRLQSDFKNLPKPDLPDKIISSFIWGEVETGKTVLATHMMLKFIKDAYIYKLKRNLVYQFVSFSDLLKELQHTYQDSKLTEFDVMQKYISCDVLVLDDFMSRRPTDWAIDIIYDLINSRYENQKTTIITSNINLEQIEELIEDQRIPSRISRQYKILNKTGWEKN